LKLRLAIGVFISLILLYWVFRDVQWAPLWLTIKGINWWWLIPTILMTYLALWVRAVRWRYLLIAEPKYAIGTLFPPTVIGFMANNVLPARMGEFVRAYAVGRKVNISKTLSFATIVVERVLDGFTLLAFLLLIVVFAPLNIPPWLKYSGQFMLAFYFTALVVLIALKFWTVKMQKFLLKVLSFFPRALAAKGEKILNSFILGLEVLKGGANFFWALFYSPLVWTTVASIFFFMLLAFNIELPLYASYLLVVILSLGMMIPSGPAYVGPFQAAIVAGLLIFQVPKTQAQGFSIVFHATQFIPITLLGLFYFWAEKLTFKEIQRSQAEEGKS
jgi:hypothetical protein